MADVRGGWVCPNYYFMSWCVWKKWKKNVAQRKQMYRQMIGSLRWSTKHFRTNNYSWLNWLVNWRRVSVSEILPTKTKTISFADQMNLNYYRNSRAVDEMSNILAKGILDFCVDTINQKHMNLWPLVPSTYCRMQMFSNSYNRLQLI